MSWENTAITTENSDKQKKLAQCIDYIKKKQQKSSLRRMIFFPQIKWFKEKQWKLCIVPWLTAQGAIPSRDGMNIDIEREKKEAKDTTPLCEHKKV